mmetsp:Transcript_10416/g.38677  ORF Transcript_10416/g.38677 Transcript_10416/m.38677 type:complete len:100 (+) Transcript_10416:5084-5383(+)
MQPARMHDECATANSKNAIVSEERFPNRRQQQQDVTQSVRWRRIFFSQRQLGDCGALGGASRSERCLCVRRKKGLLWPIPRLMMEVAQHTQSEKKGAVI